MDDWAGNLIGLRALCRVHGTRGKIAWDRQWLVGLHAYSRATVT